MPHEQSSLHIALTQSPLLMQSNLPHLRTPKLNHNFDITFLFHDNRSRVLMNAHQITYNCVNACIGTLTLTMFHQ